MEIVAILKEATDKLNHHSEGVAFNLGDLQHAIEQTAKHAAMSLEEMRQLALSSRSALGKSIEEMRAAFGEVCDSMLSHVEAGHAVQMTQLSTVANVVDQSLRDLTSAAEKIRGTVLSQISTPLPTGQLKVFPPLRLAENLDQTLNDNHDDTKVA